MGVSEAAVWDQRYRDGRDGWEHTCFCAMEARENGWLGFWSKQP